MVKIQESQNQHTSVVMTRHHMMYSPSDPPKPQILEEVRRLYLAHNVQRMLFSEYDSMKYIIHGKQENEIF